MDLRIQRRVSLNPLARDGSAVLCCVPYRTTRTALQPRRERGTFVKQMDDKQQCVFAVSLGHTNPNNFVFFDDVRAVAAGVDGLLVPDSLKAGSCAKTN